MKKYQMALKMYDFMDKVTSIFRKWMIGVLIVLILTMFSFIFLRIKLDNGHNIIMIITMIVEFLTYYGLSISHSMVINKIKKKNFDLFLYSKEDIRNFVTSKNEGYYDKELIKKEIKSIVQNQKSDDNELTSELFQYSTTNMFKNKIKEYLKYCDMESHYDVNV